MDGNGKGNASATPYLIPVKNIRGISSTIYLSNSKFTIGTSYTCQLTISEAISHIHCTLRMKSNNKWIVKAHKNSEVLVNDRKLEMREKAPLKNGDLLKLNSNVAFIFNCPAGGNKLKMGCKRQKLIKSLSNEHGDLSRTTENVFYKRSVLRENLSPTPSSYNSVSPSCVPNFSKQWKYSPNSPSYAPTSPSYAAPPIYGPVSPGDSPLSLFCKAYDDSSQSSVSPDHLYTSNTPSCHSISPLSHDWIPEPTDIDKRNSSVNIIPNTGNESSSSVTNTASEVQMESSTNRSMENESSLSEVLPIALSETVLEEENQFRNNSNDSEFFKQNAEWQDAKIQYLESKLKERHYFKEEYETSQMTIRALQNEVALLRQRVGNVEVLEAQNKRLRDEIKILEEDKRSKNELGNTISNLIDETTALKTEIKSLTSIGSMLENENSNLKQKYEEAENQLNQKLNEQKVVTGCSGKDATNEACCDAVQNVKTSLIALVENELKCSICEEIFIDATLTNCNHMFCSHCLKEWKKKKNECPFCRAKITKEFKAIAVDEYITSLLKLLSDKMYTERIQLINDRKSAAAAAVPHKKILNARSRLIDGITFSQAAVSSIMSNLPATTQPVQPVSPAPLIVPIQPFSSRVSPPYNSHVSPTYSSRVSSLYNSHVSPPYSPRVYYDMDTDRFTRTVNATLTHTSYRPPQHTAELNNVIDDPDDWKRTEFRQRHVTIIHRVMARRGFPYPKACISTWENQIFSKATSKAGYLAAISRLHDQCSKLTSNHCPIDMSMDHHDEAMSLATASTDGVSSTTSQIV